MFCPLAHAEGKEDFYLFARINNPRGKENKNHVFQIAPDCVFTLP